MNHRDRNAHNAGFKMGHISQGYKPKGDGVMFKVVGYTLFFVMFLVAGRLLHVI